MCLVRVSSHAVGQPQALALYAVVILAFQPTVAPVLDGWHMRAAARTALIIAAVGLVVLVAAALRGA